MRLSVGAAVGLALAASGATALHAAEPMNGRWAADPSFCAGPGLSPAQAPLVVTNEALRWSNDVCRIGRSYRTGDTLHLEAFCWGKGRKHAIPVSLRLHGDRIFVIWNRAPRGDLRRCK
jgi:hypothetical protein